MRIGICKFNAKNIKEHCIKTIEVEKKNGFYYYVTFKGELSKQYKSLAEARQDICSSYKDWNGFEEIKE